MASSLASMAWISGPLAPGPRPGGGAGLGLVVELDAWALALVEVPCAVVPGPDDDVSMSAAPVAVAVCRAGHLPVGHEAARAVERKGRHHAPRPPVDGHELALGRVALDHQELVVGGAVAHILDLGVVLVGPEVRHGVEHGRLVPPEESGG